MQSSANLVCALTLLALANYHHNSARASRVEPQQQQHPEPISQQQDNRTTTPFEQQQQHQQHLRPKMLANSLRPAANNNTETTPRSSLAEHQQNLTVADSWPIPSCQLGNESYQLGDRWHPVVPPFGVQACVLCECTFKTKKSQPACYESKINCRKLSAECLHQPAECPDGSQPVQQQGQCCKSCPPRGQQSSSAAAAARLSRRQARLLGFKLERIKEFQRFIAAHPAGCDKNTTSDAGERPPVDKPTGNSTSTTTTTTTTVAPGGGAASTQTKSNKMHETMNEIGIDSRAVFKSLQTPNLTANASSPTTTLVVKATTTMANNSLDSDKENQHSPGPLLPVQQQQQHQQQQQQATVTTPQSLRFVQNHLMMPPISSNGLQARKNNLPGSSHHRATTTTTISRPFAPPPCKLGNETFQVGEVWHPDLAPLGVQFCVVCNCIVKIQTNGCWESLTTCRRIEQHCRNTCRTGSELVPVEGKCCKGCSSRNGQVTAHEPVFSERTPMQDMRKYKTIVDKYPTCSAAEHKPTLAGPK